MAKAPMAMAIGAGSICHPLQSALSRERTP